MDSNKISQPNDPEVIEDAISALRVVTGMVLFCFSDEKIALKERITGNFIARGMTCVDSIYKVWKSGSEQDAWILYRSLLDRFFHLRYLHENKEFEKFDDFSFITLYDVRNKLLSDPDPIMKQKIPRSLKELQKKNRKRYDEIKKKKVKWRRPEAKEIAKKMEAKFLYDIGYDFASTHVHPMATDGISDFNRLTSPTQKGDLPDATVVRNSLLIQTVMMREAFNISNLKWRSIVFSFLDDIQNFLNGDELSYRITFMKLANAGPDFELCTQSNEI